MRAAAASRLARRTLRCGTLVITTCAADPDGVLWTWQCGRPGQRAVPSLWPAGHHPRRARLCRGRSPLAPLFPAVVLAPADAGYGKAVWVCVVLPMSLCASLCVLPTCVHLCAGCAASARLLGDLLTDSALQKQFCRCVTFHGLYILPSVPDLGFSLDMYMDMYMLLRTCGKSPTQ